MINMQYYPDTSPAFIIDQHCLKQSIDIITLLREQTGCKVLYSVKALPLTLILETFSPYIDGFSVSSLFEAKLATQYLQPRHSVHLATPGIRPDECDVLSQVCSHVSANSLTQKQSFSKAPVSLGLRINPKLSLVNDVRFDPCRPYSKLGIDINLIDQQMLQGIEGLHIHTVFSQEDYSPLLQTVKLLEQQLGHFLSSLKWLNLGGGYLFKQITHHQAFIDMALSLRQRYGLELYIEPGKALVNDALSLVASVIDCFSSDGKSIAVLDTSINHNPEVFEYQRRPAIAQEDTQGNYPILLAGSSCLAGDIFGEYVFKKPLKIGDKITFTNLGAYTLVKANRFNGYNFADIYHLQSGELKLIKHYSYQYYKQQWEC